MHTVTRLRRRWPKGTWMRLKSPELLRAFVGDPLKDASKRMSGRQLAKYVDVHPSFIDHLLAGRRTSCEPGTAERIAEVLGVPLNVLFDPKVPTTARQTVQHSAHNTLTRAA
jgi:hypothetical protein